MTESELKQAYDKNHPTSADFLVERCGCIHAKLSEDYQVMCEYDGKYTHPTFCASCSHKEANHDNQSN